MKEFERMIENLVENFKRLHTFCPIETKYNINEVKKAFKLGEIVSNSLVESKLSDGRVVSWWNELTAASLYNLNINEDGNALDDLYIDLNIPSHFIHKIRIGVKSLTKGGLDLMQSGFKGRGFKDINQQNRMLALILSVLICDYHIIIDMNNAPIYYYLPISSKEIIFKAYLGKLPLVIKRSDFYNLFYGKSLEEMIIDGDFKVF